MKMGFEETELRLGLPGNIGATSEGDVMRNKRGFSETETIETVDLMLNLSSKEATPNDVKSLANEKSLLPSDPAKPPANVIFESTDIGEHQEPWRNARTEARVRNTSS
ncbi:hypothetical protein TanjilG_28369 [Lupinus angustifolius]|uniref:Uncharacterized protein n=1 Tax=Lupinus angustifolius TaxID=3871 RepID=A0A4P1RIQ7_LUPAN|nr:hypothetical protein TanjilG_28369 [Lupinus angustifolius]